MYNTLWVSYIHFLSKIFFTFFYLFSYDELFITFFLPLSISGQCSFLYPLKTSKHQRFSDVLRVV